VRTRYSHQTFTLAQTFPGSVIVAKAALPGMAPITFVSVYTVIDVYSQTTLLRIVADLIPLFDSVNGTRVILGGDLNLGTDTAGEPGLSRYRAIFGAIESLGLINLYEHIDDRPPPPDDCRCGRTDCRHLTTRDGGGNFDYLFATPELANQCQRVVRFDDPDTKALSDHWPIAAEFSAQSSRPWDVETFAQELGKRHGVAVARAFDVITDWAERKERQLRAEGHDRWTLTRFPIPDGVDPECWLQLDLDRGAHKIQYTISIKATGKVVVQFRYMTLPPFQDPEVRSELARRLNQIDGIRLDRTQGRPWFPIDVIADSDRLKSLLDAIQWIVDETVASPEENPSPVGQTEPPAA
jgi:hypothetical protein